MRADIITHCGIGIGFGHLMRSSALGEALIARGVEVRFVLPDESGVDYLNSMGYSGVVRKASWRIPPDNTANLYVIDHYQVDEEYFSPFCKLASVAYIDDLCKGAYPVAAVVNGHFYGKSLPYETYFPNATHLLGTEYCLLRSVYRNTALNGRHHEDGIMLTTGGTDPQNLMSYMISEAQLAIGDRMIPLHVVIGAGYSSEAELADSARRDSRIVLHYRPEHLADIMAQCRLAVSAAGTTLYELAVMGIPALSWEMVDNQHYVLDSAEKEGLVRVFNPSVPGNLSKELEELLNSPAVVDALRIRLQQRVDGYGAERVADRLIELIGKR